MNRKRLFVCMLCAVVAANIFGGAQRQKKVSDSQIRVVLDWTPNTNHTGLYVAQELGYFTDEGIAVSITQPPEGGGLLLVSAGGAEFGVDFQESMGPAIARKQDALPVQAVAAIISHNTSGIMSLSKSGINRPRDLMGKRFAFWETPLVIEVMRDLVEGDGGDFSALAMIPNAATDAFSALETDVDAIWIYYAWDGIAAEVNNVSINYLDMGVINPVFDFYTPVLVTNKDWAAANPDKARKFLHAVSRGYTYAMEHPAEAANILLKHAPELDRALVTKSQEYLATRYADKGHTWGEIDGERWGRFYGWMFERGLLEQDIQQAGFTNEFLRKD